MRINQMNFDDDGNGVQPTSLNVTITLEEAIWIAKNAGKQQGSSPHNEIYNSLCGDFFNRFWEDGINTAEMETPVEIQPTLKWGEVAISKDFIKEIIKGLDDSEIGLIIPLKEMISEKN